MSYDGSRGLIFWEEGEVDICIFPSKNGSQPSPQDRDGSLWRLHTLERTWHFASLCRHTLSPCSVGHCGGVRCCGAESMCRKLASLKDEWLPLLLCQRVQPPWEVDKGNWREEGHTSSASSAWPSSGLVVVLSMNMLLVARGLALPSQCLRDAGSSRRRFGCWIYHWGCASALKRSQTLAGV